MIKAVFSKSINDLTTENLYQWDSYQTLSISGIDFLAITPKVHFCNKKSTEALAVEGVLQADGSCQVSIPNTLLSEKYDIVAYIYTNTGLTYKTIKSITIPIIPRLKPSEYYQPSNEDIIEIEAIELQAKLILEGLYATEYSDSTSYKRPNIVYYNNGAYMCKSNVSISGVLPTDSSNWQLIVQGEYISSMSVNSEGKLVLTTTTGNTYSIDFQTKNVSLADSTDIPALALTKGNVDILKKISLENVTIGNDSNWYILNPGIYLVNVVSNVTSYDYSFILYVTDVTKPVRSNMTMTLYRETNNTEFKVIWIDSTATSYYNKSALKLEIGSHDTIYDVATYTINNVLWVSAL